MHLREAEVLLDGLGVSFDRVEFFKDAGLGVHGLPFQVLRYQRDWLDQSYLFECGHSLMTPDLYREIASLKRSRYVVLTAFKPHPANLRQPVIKDGRRIRLTSAPSTRSFALAHPAVIDRRYAGNLPSLDFNIDRIIEHYSAQARLRYAFSDMPPEFDLVAEMDSAFPVYAAYLRDRGLVGSWQAG